MDKRQRTWNTHNTTHGPHEAQEERRPKVDDSVLLKKWNNIIKGSRGWEEEMRGNGKVGQNQVWDDMGEKSRGISSSLEMGRGRYLEIP